MIIPRCTVALRAPFIQESCVEIAQDRVKTRYARKRADVVENFNLYRILRLGAGYWLLPLLGGGSFLGSDEPRAEIDPDCAEDERRRDAAPVGDAAGRDDLNGATQHQRRIASDSMLTTRSSNYGQLQKI
jgi:hypothetical protein